MRQSTYVLYDKQNEVVSDHLCNQILIEKKIYSENSELTVDILKQITDDCTSEYFYVIKTDVDIIFNTFDFTYTPAVWDKDYVHIWNNDSTVRLYNTQNIRDNLTAYTDVEFLNGKVSLKQYTDRLYSYPMFAVVFLSYDEEGADANYEKLRAKIPRIQRVHNVKGIFEAHMAAAQYAKQSNSSMFYVVDADADILPTFDFNYRPHSLDLQSVIVWHSRNPVNGLEYGYGGVKLFPTDLLLNYKGSPIDFTTSVSNSFKVINEVSNITRFNTDPYSAWRSGFRECVKLASKLIPNQDNTETEHRLNAWCTLGAETLFGDFAVMGAIEGAEFGKLYINQSEMLGLINDFDWLEQRFSS
jgi:hypothetical protein